MDILCVQETRWKGKKARCIGGGYKMWYCGSGSKKNGVGIILKKEHVDRVVKLWRITDRIICLKMELDGVMLNVISAYAPQVGCIREEKETFWLDLDETGKKIPKNKRIVVGADLNEHVREGKAVMKNAWADMIWKEKLRRTSSGGLSYHSGGRSSQVD